MTNYLGGGFKFSVAKLVEERRKADKGHNLLNLIPQNQDYATLSQTFCNTHGWA